MSTPKNGARGRSPSSIWMLAAAAVLLPLGQEPAPRSGEKAAGESDKHPLEQAFLEHGIRLDAERGLCTIPVTVDVREDLLEYLLVAPRGAAHESLFVTEVVPSRLNAALLTLGATPGVNAQWRKRDPPPTPSELAEGAAPYEVESPSGDGFYMYAAWREAGETYFFRIEDLLRNLETGRGMRRHAWVFLGSRMVRMRSADEKEVFAADLEGNLVNIAFFEQGNTLLTAALPECLRQTIWIANGWLLPERGSTIDLIFSRQPLATISSEAEARLPVVPDDPDGDGR